MCKELGITRISRTAYQPEGNAMIERTNGTIKESLAKYVGEHHNNWSDYLPASNDGVQIINSLCYEVQPLLPPFWTIMRAAD